VGLLLEGEEWTERGDETMRLEQHRGKKAESMSEGVPRERGEKYKQKIFVLIFKKSGRQRTRDITAVASLFYIRTGV
jgi:hypothetical protein